MLEEEVCYWHKNVEVNDEYYDKCFKACDGYDSKCPKYVPINDVNSDAVKSRVLG